MAGNIIPVHDGFVYRNGKARHKDMTPRPNRDVSSNLRAAGLSTWRDLEAGIEPGGKRQKIDLAKLDAALLAGFEDQDGHVSIVPVDESGNIDMIKLTEWAATWGSGEPHPLTSMVMDAITERNVRRPT